MRLSDMRHVSLVDRRGYLTIIVEIENEDNLLMRRPENVKEWSNILQKMVKESKSRMIQNTEHVLTKKTGVDPEKLEEWLLARRRIGALYHYTNEREERPSSVASVDRRRQKKQRKRATSECKFILVLSQFSIIQAKTN